MIRFLCIFTANYTHTTMPRQLTPEEMKIIRQTEQEGAELAQKEKAPDSRKSTLKRLLKNLLILAAVFIFFVMIAYLIVKNVS